MSLYAERAYFDGDHCQHVAARDEHLRLERAQRRLRLDRPDSRETTERVAAA